MGDIVGKALNVGSFGLIDEGVLSNQAPTIGREGTQFTEEEKALSDQQQALLTDLQGRQEQGLDLSQEEATQLQQLQQSVTERVGQAGRAEADILPALFATLGFKPEKDARGRVTGVSRLSQEEQEQFLSPLERDNLQIAQKTAGRQLRLLSGGADVDQSLEKELESSRRRLQESLSRRLGPGFEETTVGQAALQGFEESSTRLRQESERRLIREGSEAVAATSGLAAQQNQQRQSQLSGLANNQFAGIARDANLLTGTPSGAQRALAGVNSAIPLLTGGFQATQQPFQFNRQLLSGVEAQQAGLQGQANAANTAFSRELFGTALGAATGASG